MRAIVEQALEREPEELALFVLEYLSETEEHLMNLNNALIEARHYSPDQNMEIPNAITERGCGWKQSGC